MRHILLEEWDLIGVRNELMAADEYDGYIGLFEMLERNATTLEIVEYLRWVEVVRMGLGEPRWPSEHCENFLGASRALDEVGDAVVELSSVE